MFKKVNKSIAWLVIAVLVFSVFASLLATVTFASAVDYRQIDLTSNFQMNGKVEYGDDFSVPAYSKVVAPNNQEIGTATASARDINANQLGLYEVSVRKTASDTAYYKYFVKCYIDDEYILTVDNNAAALPTYWKNTADKKIDLPNANAFVYSEDEDIYVKDSSQKVSLRVTSPSGVISRYVVNNATGKVAKDGGAEVDLKTAVDGKSKAIDQIALTENGLWFFTYYTEIKGATNILSKEYTVQVDKQFEDTKAPTLNVSAVEGTGSINTKVSIPVADVNDNFDSRVMLQISVKHNYNGVVSDVPLTVVDKKTGYVTSANEIFKDKDTNQPTADFSKAAKASFDNDMFMYFYPTETGAYTITYVAKDSTNYYGVNNKTATIEYPFTINVSDLTAPVFDKIDDYKIPTSWGNKVYNYVKDGRETGEELARGTNIEFPIPELYDNYIDASDIVVRFEMKDPRGTEVAVFKNINATEASAASCYIPSNNHASSVEKYYFFNDEANSKYTTDANGILWEGSTKLGYNFRTCFNFENWNPKYVGASRTGDYSVMYKAYDTAGAPNNATKEYSIRFSDEYRDLVEPNVDFTAADYVAFANSKETFSINDVILNDSNDSRIKKEYYIVFNSSFVSADGKYTSANIDTILNGATAADKIELDSTSGYNSLEVTKDGSNCIVKGTNARGVEQKITVNLTSKAYIVARATDCVDNSNFKVQLLSVVDATSASGKTITLDFAAHDANKIGKAGTEFDVGSFSINYNLSANRKYTGFELYVQRIIDESSVAISDKRTEAPLSNVTFETYSDNTGTANVIHVDNVRFNPTKAGVYQIVCRGYDISGVSTVKIVTIEVEGTAGGNENILAASIADEGDINLTYTLPAVSGNSGDYIVRSITGGRMALMYDQFTAMSQGAYSFKDYAAKPSGTTIGYTSTRTNNDTRLVYSINNSKSAGNYTFASHDHESPVLRVQGVMPVYTSVSDDKDTVILTLPKVSASSANGIPAEVECQISVDSGKSESDTVPAVWSAGNAYSFKVLQHGTYTVKYSATLNGNSSSVTFTIKAGNVVPPSFRVLDTGLNQSKGGDIIGYIKDKAIVYGSAAVATIDDTFKFGIIQSDGDTTGYTYTKQLYAPNSELIDTVTGAAKRENKTMTFTMSGTYTVVYTVTNQYGVSTTVKYYITVNSSTSTISPDVVTTLSVVLLIVAIVLIVFTVVYIIRFRKRKS